jgi:hypothetical protein
MRSFDLKHLEAIFTQNGKPLPIKKANSQTVSIFEERLTFHPDMNNTHWTCLRRLHVADISISWCFWGCVASRLIGENYRRIVTPVITDLDVGTEAVFAARDGCAFKLPRICQRELIHDVVEVHKRNRKDVQCTYQVSWTVSWHSLLT